jgi:hypothetical protein
MWCRMHKRPPCTVAALPSAIATSPASIEYAIALERCTLSAYRRLQMPDMRGGLSRRKHSMPSSQTTPHFVYIACNLHQMIHSHCTWTSQRSLQHMPWRSLCGQLVRRRLQFLLGHLVHQTQTANYIQPYLDMLPQKTHHTRKLRQLLSTMAELPHDSYSQYTLHCLRYLTA